MKTTITQIVLQFKVNVIKKWVYMCWPSDLVNHKNPSINQLTAFHWYNFKILFFTI